VSKFKNPIVSELNDAIERLHMETEYDVTIGERIPASRRLGDLFEARKRVDELLHQLDDER